MSKNNKKKDKKIKDIENKFDLGNACCSGDCTGLIQNIPINDYQRESYEQIYDYQHSD